MSTATSAVTTFLNFLGTTIEFDVEPDASVAFAPIAEFFRHHMSDEPLNADGCLVHVRAYSDQEIPAAVWRTPLTSIRKSSTPDFEFDAHVVSLGTRRQYVNRATLLDAPLDATLDRRFELGITTRSAIQVIDFIRDVVIRTEEQRGTVSFHAAAVTNGPSAVLIGGAKGAGKTTTLLAAMTHAPWRYFSGDKVFCEPTPTGVNLHPWRDYPHVGVGTIRSHPALEEQVRAHVDEKIDQRTADEKLLIDPELFEPWVNAEFSAKPARLTGVLLPGFRADRALAGVAVAEPNARWGEFNKLLDRQVDRTFFSWHSHLVPDYAAFFNSFSAMRDWLVDLPMWRLSGAPSNDPHEVLRDTLGRLA